MNGRMKPWAALALGMVVGGLVGSLANPPWAAGAQEAETPPEDRPPAEYPYLPERFGQPFIPSVADWQALRLTALGAATTRITAEFHRQHVTCFPTQQGLFLTLDLLPVDGWEGYAGGGRFNIPDEEAAGVVGRAVGETLRFVRIFFPEVQDENLAVQVHVNSERVGLWRDGELTLAPPPLAPN
jgi:hypothetical protein